MKITCIINELRLGLGPHYGQVQVLQNLQRSLIILHEPTGWLLAGYWLVKTQIHQNEVKLMKNLQQVHESEGEWRIRTDVEAVGGLGSIKLKLK